MAQAHLGEQLDLGLSLRCVAHTIGPVDLFGDGFDLFLDRVLVGVEELEVGRLLAGFHDGLGQFRTTGCTLHPDPALGHGECAGLGRALADEGHFGVGIVLEAVDGHHHRHTELERVLDVLQQVGQARLQQLQVLLGVGPVQRPAGDDLGATTVHLQSAHGGNQDDAVGLQPAVAALEIHELFHATVGAKAGLGHHIVGQPQGDLVGNDRAIALGDVGKGTAVHKGRAAGQCLHQVGHDGVLQQDGHRASAVQILGRNRLHFAWIGQATLLAGANDDPAHACSEVL